MKSNPDTCPITRRNNAESQTAPGILAGGKFRFESFYAAKGFFTAANIARHFGRCSSCRTMRSGYFVP